MTVKFPESVTLIEVGPRDGFQFESRLIPTELKYRIVRLLMQAGLKEIQVASFVNPRKVPQMADSENLVAMLPMDSDIIFSGVVLNRQGLIRAIQAGLRHIDVSVSASESHSQKNMGMSIEMAMKSTAEMIKIAHTNNVIVRGGIQCAFGCGDDPEIPVQEIVVIVSEFLSWGVSGICLADTAGTAGPLSIMERLDSIMPLAGNTPVDLHLHDTWGIGLTNVLTALQYGVTRFDASFGGIGGCPFLPNASGNIATEDTVGLMSALNIHTGVDIKQVAECSIMMETFLEKKLPGKRYSLFKDTKN
jgi:hydroxymethylglutaryl-CoA lyase